MVGKLTKLYISVFLLLISLSLYGQNDLFRRANNQEAHMSFDRPYYISGQKVWFSLWLFDADSQRPLSGLKFMELRLVDKTGQVVIDKRIKVEQGRSYGQFALPLAMPTHEYLVHLAYQKEAPEEYIHASKIPIYNRQEAFDPDLSTQQSQLNLSDDVTEGAEVVLMNNQMGTKKRLSYDFILDQATEASINVLVRKIDASSNKGFNQTDLNDLNRRSNRPLHLKNVYNHPYLQFDLELISPPKDSIFPLIFIPESHQQLGFLKATKEAYTLDATDISPGLKTFYFNQFIYRAYIPPDLEWDYEKERYKDNLVPYYEGEMKFKWETETHNFAQIVSHFKLEKPIWYDYVKDFAHQTKVSELMASSEAYPVYSVVEEQVDSLGMTPMLWRNTADFDAMDNMAEFLFEIVTGIKAYYSDKRKDIRVLNVDGPYHGIPLVLVNGVPTRDMEKVLNIPIEDILGAGVIKDHKSRGQYKYNLEARPYGAFSSTGLIVIKLKPDVINPFRSDFEVMLKKEVYLEPLTYPNLDYADQSQLMDVPDLRTTLVWEPNMTITRKKTNLSLYTSDIPGSYEMIITGVKKGGGLIYIKESFEVNRDYE